MVAAKRSARGAEGEVCILLQNGVMGTDKADAGMQGMVACSIALLLCWVNTPGWSESELVPFALLVAG